MQPKQPSTVCWNQNTIKHVLWGNTHESLSFPRRSLLRCRVNNSAPCSRCSAAKATPVQIPGLYISSYELRNWTSRSLRAPELILMRCILSLYTVCPVWVWVSSVVSHFLPSSMNTSDYSTSVWLSHCPCRLYFHFLSPFRLCILQTGLMYAMVQNICSTSVMFSHCILNGRDVKQKLTWLHEFRNYANPQLYKKDIIDNFESGSSKGSSSYRLRDISFANCCFWLAH